MATKRVALMLLYCASIVAATLLHFGYHIADHYNAAKTQRVLKQLFNSRIRTVRSTEEQKYYILVRKLILYEEYFRHLDLQNMILKYDCDKYTVLRREWANMTLNNKDVFLFYSVSYNVGIFMPIFLPIAMHVIKSLQNLRRGSRKMQLYAWLCNAPRLARKFTRSP